MIQYRLIDYNDIAQGEHEKWKQRQEEMHQWCLSNLSHMIAFYDNSLFFETEQDYAMFLLRWA